MTDLLLTTLPKVLLPALAIVVLLFVAKRRGFSLAEDLGLRKPEWKFAAFFLILWVCLIALEESVTRGMAGAGIKVWPAYPALILFLRILAIGVLGPIAEELVFRGLFLRMLGRTRVGIYGAILITAALWSIIHLQYAPILLAIIFIDGLALGLARHFTKSLYVPIAMHILGNLFSIYQSLSP
ncbi:MAG: CPBP family intramembrane glutamic endopeptidase [Pseudomonadota bacterium]